MVNPVELFELRDIKDYDTAVKYTGKQSDLTLMVMSTYAVFG